MSNIKKIFSNTFWLVSGRFIQAFIGIVGLKILTDIFPADVYGQYVTLFEYIGFYAIAADFGLFTISVAEMSKENERKDEIFSTLLFLRVLMIIIFLGSAVFITPFLSMYQGTLIEKGIGMVALMTGFTLLSSTMNSVLQFEMEMKKAAINQLITKIGYLIGLVYLWKFKTNYSVGGSFDFLLEINLLFSFALLILTYFSIRKYVKFFSKISKSYVFHLVKKSLPYGLALMLNKFYFKVDVLMIQSISGNFEAGIYGIPIKLMEILNLIPVFFMNSCLPVMGKLFKKSKESFSNLILGILKSLFVVILPVVICGSFTAFNLTSSLSNSQFLTGYHCVSNTKLLFLDKQDASEGCKNLKETEFKFERKETNDSFVYYAGSDFALKIILVALLFAFLNVVFNYYLLISDQQSKLLKFNGIALLTNVLLNLILIPKYGFIGASAVTVLCEFLILALGYSAYRKDYEFNFDIKFVFQVLGLSLIVGLFSFYFGDYLVKSIGSMGVILNVLASSGLYFYGVWKLKILSIGEIKILFSDDRLVDKI